MGWKPTMRWVFPLLVVAMTLCAYGPVVWRGGAGFIWDDDDYVMNAAAYGEARPLAAIWLEPRMTPQYYPVVFTTFYIERALWGLNPLGFHLVNVLLHAGSAVLLWRVLERLEVPGAKLGAAVFAVHPMMVESVAWVTERKNTLCLVFCLMALLAFLRFAGIGKGGEGGRRKGMWYAGALFAFVLAMLSKSVACGLAPVLVLMVWWKGAAARERWKGYWGTVPFFVIGLMGGLHTAYLEVHHVGARGEVWELGMARKVLLAGQALWFYLGKLVWPTPLSFYYTRWEIVPGVWWQWLAPLGVVLVVAVLVLQRKVWGRGPVVAALGFIAVLFPALGFFAVFPMIFSWVADHFAYLAGAVMVPALCALATVGVRRAGLGRWWRGGLVAVLLLVLGAKTYATAGNYRSFKTLWGSVLAYDPERPHWNALSGMSMVLHEEAAQLRAQGRKVEAGAKDEEARRCDERSVEVRPDYALGYVNLAGDALMRGEASEALALAERAAGLDPVEASAHYTRGVALERLGRGAEALEAYRRAAELAPRKVRYRLVWARALLAAGDGKAARERCEEALRLMPTEAQKAEAMLLLAYDDAAARRFDRALPALREARRLDPGNPEIGNGLARAAALAPGMSEAELREALAAAQEAVQATGGAVPAYVESEALVMDRLGRRREAAEKLEALLQRMGDEYPVIRASVEANLARLRSGETTTLPAGTPASQQGAR